MANSNLEVMCWWRGPLTPALSPLKGEREIIQ